MEFALCFKGTMQPDRARYLVRQAEDAGFTYCWFYDSHILWRESFMAMAMCMEHTKAMRFGPCVTNPNTRDWSVAASMFASLAYQSGGRFDVGLGRGDSAVRVMGQKPATLARVAEFTQKVKAMVRGEEVIYGECSEPVQFTWATGYDLPVWIAAYGPMALKTAGECGDGLILQIAEPAICKWLADQAISAGRAAGRDMRKFKVMSTAPAYVGPMELCIEKTKWFPAMVGNHIADIVEKYGKNTDVMPQNLLAYIEKRRGYDYSHHGESDNPYLEFITPEIVDDFAVLGDTQRHVAKIRALEDAGINQFNIPIENGEEEHMIAFYANSVIPHFRE